MKGATQSRMLAPILPDAAVFVLDSALIVMSRKAAYSKALLVPFRKGER